MTEDFKVSITGDVTGLTKSITYAEKELSAFASKSRELKTAIAETKAISVGYDQAIRELSGSFKTGAISQAQFKTGLLSLKQAEKETIVEVKRLELELANLNRTSAGLSKIVPQTSGHMHGMSKAVGDVGRVSSHSTNTMMEFSRVVQDAPYGIRGVANNIQQLVTNFGYLSKASGGAGAALKGMVSSLMGPAGILLAVSLVTSLLVQYGDKLFSTKTKTEKLREETEKAKKAVDEFITSLTGLETVDLNVRIKIAQEKNTATNLFNQMRLGATDALKQGALDALKEKYPNLFEGALKGVTIATAKAGDLATIIQHIETQGKEMTRSLEAKKEFDDNIEGAENLRQQIISLNKEVSLTKAAYDKLKDVPIGKHETKKVLALSEAFNEYNKAVKKVTVEVPKIQKEIAKLNTENLRLNAQITLTVDEPKAKSDIEKVGKAKPIRLPVEIVLVPALKGLNETEKLLKDAFGRPIPSNQFKILDNLPLVVGETNSKIAYILNDLKDRIPKDLFGNLTSLSLEQLTQFQNKLGETEQVAYIFNDALGAGFNALGNQIASSLATGNAVLDALVSSLINSLTSIATALIQQAITEKLISAQVLATNVAKSNANGITIATSAAAAMGPAGIVALPGLIAAELALINSAFAGIAIAGAFAGGGIVGGGSYSGDRMQAYVNSGEMILNGRQQGNLFDILDGNLRRLSAPSQMTQVSVTGELRGSTILLANARADKNNNRFYGRK